MKCAVSKSGWQSIHRASRSASSVPWPDARRVASMISSSLIAKPRVVGAEPSREFANHEMVGPRLGHRLDQPRPRRDVLVAAALVYVVVFDEGGGGQHDVGVGRRVGHELLVDAQEQVVAREAAVHQRRFRRHHRRVGVLHQHRHDRRAAGKRRAVAGEDRADPRHVEHPHRGIAHVEPLDQRLVPMVDVAVGIERAAALVPPTRRSRPAGS